MKTTASAIFGFTIVLLLVSILNQKQQRTIRQQGRLIDSLQVQLSYFEDTYHFRVGRVQIGPDVKTLRLLSIDGGKTWLLLTRTREVQGSRYLHIKYPHIDPETLQEVY